MVKIKIDVFKKYENTIKFFIAKNSLFASSVTLSFKNKKVRFGYESKLLIFDFEYEGETDRDQLTLDGLLFMNMISTAASKNIDYVIFTGDSFQVDELRVIIKGINSEVLPDEIWQTNLGNAENINIPIDIIMNNIDRFINTMPKMDSDSPGVYGIRILPDEIRATDKRKLYSQKGEFNIDKQIPGEILLLLNTLRGKENINIYAIKDQNNSYLVTDNTIYSYFALTSTMIPDIKFSEINEYIVLNTQSLKEKINIMFSVMPNPNIQFIFKDEKTVVLKLIDGPQLENCIEDEIEIEELNIANIKDDEGNLLVFNLLLSSFKSGVSYCTEDKIKIYISNNFIKISDDSFDFFLAKLIL